MGRMKPENFFKPELGLFKPKKANFKHKNLKPF